MPQMWEQSKPGHITCLITQLGCGEFHQSRTLVLVNISYQAGEDKFQELILNVNALYAQI